MQQQQQQQLAVPTQTSIGLSRSFDASESVITRYQRQTSQYLDDYMLLTNKEPKIAPAADASSHRLAPRRSSTTALDYYQHGNAILADFRTKSASPSRIACSGSPKDKRFNIAQTSPRLVRKYGSWTTESSPRKKLSTAPERKKSKSAVFSSKDDMHDMDHQEENEEEDDDNNQRFFSLQEMAAFLTEDADRYHSDPEDIGSRKKQRPKKRTKAAKSMNIESHSYTYHVSSKVAVDENENANMHSKRNQHRGPQSYVD
eukprot:CAMPEP_0197050618 /NCGR_PEP_ID=MMETSP1384-20130603/25480_1 /TAXON_ID=29189 /ORGANISM="Ammonia sp." /LENGTH=257 /DNA_ID=CAMNT_0042483053 /DNA_START=1 /DNA_END=774 /DNA_ORIENTATION=+